MFNPNVTSTLPKFTSFVQLAKSLEAKGWYEGKSGDDYWVFYKSGFTCKMWWTSGSIVFFDISWPSNKYKIYRLGCGEVRLTNRLNAFI